jgi:WD40 repeat protein
MLTLRRSLLVLGAVFVLGWLTPARSQEKQAPGTSQRLDLFGDPLTGGAVARLGSSRFHHQGGLIAAAFAPDGKCVVVGGLEGSGVSLRFWQLPDGKELSRFNVEGMDLGSLAWTPDGKGVLVGRQFVVELYDRKSGKLLRTYGNRELPCTTFALSADGSMIAGFVPAENYQNTIHVWEVATGGKRAILKAQSGHPITLKFKSDGKQLLSATAQVQYGVNVDGKTEMKRYPGSICIWDIGGQKKLHDVANGGHQVALSADGVSAAYLTPENQIAVHNIATGKSRCVIPDFGTFFQFTSDGKGLITSTELSAPTLWDIETGKQARAFQSQPGLYQRLAGISGDGKYLAVLTGRWQMDGTLLLWDVASGSPVHHDAGHSAEVTSVAFAPGGKLLASGSLDRTVRLWDVATSKEIAKLEGHKGAVLAVAFAPDGKTLASCGADGTTRLWEIPSGRQLAKLDGPVTDGAGVRIVFDEGAEIRKATLAFSRDGKTLVAGSPGGDVSAWQLDGKRTGRSLSVGKGGTPLALSRDARLLLTANSEGIDGVPDGWGPSVDKARIWSTTSGQPLQDIALRPKKDEDHSQLACWTGAFSADDWLVAVSHSHLSQTLRGTMVHMHKVRIWERATGEEILSIKDLRIHALAFSPDGRHLALGHGHNFGFHNTKLDRDVTLWDTLTGQRVRTFAGHANQINCVAFSPDGKLLASGSADHTVLIWNDIPPNQAKANADVPAETLKQWWDNMADKAATAYQAFAGLAAHGGQAVKLVKDHLKPAPAVETKRIENLIKELDNPKYNERQQATVALEELGELAEPALRQTLAGNPSLECRRRIEVLLEKVEKAPATPAQMRVLRALAVLERIATPEAREALQTLARGAPEARQTRLAQDALERLGK